jgi:signal peptide peptidase SppA
VKVRSRRLKNKNTKNIKNIKKFSISNGDAWAIKKSGLEKLIALAKADGIDTQIERFGNSEISSPYSNIAVINITDTIFRYDNVFMSWFGGSSVEAITNAFDEALADDTVNAILLNMNSPGGVVDGVAELSAKIYSSKGIKPIYAYVGGEAASAAYWLGSSADKMIINETAAVGSIGVYSIYYDYTKAMDNAGIKEITIVSSLSPKKVPDPADDKGKKQIQSHIDTYANIFIEAVARNRRVAVDEVIANYGQGDIVIGKEAIEKGMADEIGTFETAIESLNKIIAKNNEHKNKKKSGVIFNIGGQKKMTIENIEDLRAENPEIFAQVLELGASQERQRIQELEELANAETTDILAKVKFDGKTTKKDAALLILEANKEKMAKLKISREKDAEDIPKIETEPEINAEDKAVQGLVSAANKVTGGNKNDKSFN